MQTAVSPLPRFTISPTSPTTPVHYAARSIAERLERMLWYAPRVAEGGDEDALRQMRVWSRRARAALEGFDFCLGSEALRPLRREVKAVTRALGHVRDLDMIAESLTKHAQGLPGEQRAAVEPLLARLRDRRGELQQMAAETVRAFERSKPMEQLATAVLRRAASSEAADMPQLFVRAGLVINERARDVLDYEAVLADPESVEELHEMRASVKRLRYTLEVFLPLYQEYTSAGRQVAAALSEAESLQDRLGHIHDADVLVPWLTERLGEMLQNGYGQGQDGEALAGVNLVDYDQGQAVLALCQVYRADRQRHHQRVLDQWARLQRDGFFEELRSTLRSAIREAAACTLPAPSPDGPREYRLPLPGGERERRRAPVAA